jgi:hypothetical protein
MMNCWTGNGMRRKTTLDYITGLEWNEISRRLKRK